mgnify:CR=1 FL=1
MIIRLLNWAIGYWMMLNYVFYKFYSRREKDPEIRGLIYAPGWIFFNYLTIMIVWNYCFSPILSVLLNHKILCFILPYFIVIILNYIFLYYKGKWKDIFKEIDKERDTDETQKKYRNTVIYIWVSIALFLIPVIVKGLINQFG